MFIANEQVFLMNKQKAVRLCLKVHYGQLRKATTGRQKSSPFLASSLSLTATELVEVQGLHSLFACLRTINPAVVFFCHTFCNPRTFGTLLFLVPQKNQ